MELTEKYRPKTLDEVIGQPGAVAVLRKMMGGKKFPHVLLFHGQSGTGKTTMARIVMTALGCHDLDFHEINAADQNGIADVRRMIDKMPFVPHMGGKARCWLWDESHLMSSEAQNAMLKPCEGTPSHCYIIFATTHPHKMIPTLLNRCTQIEVKRVGDKDIRELVERIAKQEKPKVPLSKEVIRKIVEKADGGVRKAVKDLEKVLPIVREEERLEAIGDVIEERETKTIAQMIFATGRTQPTWKDAVAVVKSLKGDVEKVRHGVLGYACAILGNQPNPDTQLAKKCLAVIDLFRDDWYSCRAAGLYAALAECFKK